jgi:hypothetical protein
VLLLLLPPGHLPNQLPKLPVGSLDEGTTNYCDYIDHGCCGATRWGRRRGGVLDLVGWLWRRIMLLDGHSLNTAAPNLYVWPLAASGGVAGRTTRIGCASACSPSVRGHCIFGSSSHILKAIVMPPRASLLCVFMLFTQPQRQQRLALPPQYAGDATTVHWLAVPNAACTKMLTCFTLSRFQRGPS